MFLEIQAELFLEQTPTPMLIAHDSRTPTSDFNAWECESDAPPTLLFILSALEARIVTMTRFRPCIDLHAGSVKQIVGGTLTTTDSDLKTNYVSKLPAGYYGKLYRENDLAGAHVIMLGPGNDDAATEACQAWPNGLQVGGGINDTNAREWIERGAEKVCINMSCLNKIVLFHKSHTGKGDLQFRIPRFRHLTDLPQ